MQDGLTNQIVTSVCEDGRGMLWIGTQNGLYRFDGFRVTRFVDNLRAFRPIEYVTDLEYLSVPGSTGYLLVCTWGKGWLVDVSNDRTVPFETLGYPSNLLDKCTQIERLGENNFWVIADSTLYHLEDTGAGKFSADSIGVAAGGAATTILADPTSPGAIWLLPVAQEVLHVSASGIYTRYPLPKFHKNPAPIPGMLGLVQTSKGLIGWDYMRNLYRLNPKNNKFEPENRLELTDIFPVLAALDRYYKQRNVLRLHHSLPADQEAIGTTLGLFISQKRVNQFHLPEGMVGSEVRGILTDSLGNWWAGTYNGLFMGAQNHNAVRQVSKIAGMWGGIPLDSNDWMLVCENRVGIFLLNRKDNTVRKPPALSPMEMAGSALSICRDYWGNIWVGTYTNLYWSPAHNPFRFNMLKFPNSHKPVQAPFFRALMVDRDSSLWAGAENGLFRLNLREFPRQWRMDTLLENIFISDLYLDRYDNIWVATKGGGLALYDRHNNTFTWYNTDQGLANNSTCRIESSDADKVLWISTHNGLSRLDIGSRVIHNYHEDDGIPGNEFNSAASARFPDGTLMFGGVAGLVQFHPDSLRPSIFQYKTMLSQFHVQLNKNDSIQLLPPAPGRPLQLPPYPHLVEIFLGVNDYVQSAAPRFRYRLLSAFESWIDIDGESKIRLFNLSPGSYVLEVQALPYDGHLGQPVCLNIFVAQPVSESWWFRALLLAGLVLISYFAYRYRLRQVVRRYAIRQQIADDLHDDIGNKLNMTNILLQKVKRDFLDKNLPPPADIWAGLLEANQHTLQSLRTLIWSVDPRKDRLENILARMQDFADDFLRPLNIQCRFFLPEQVPDRETLLDFRHNVIMIFQELLTNMVKHAPPRQLTVHLAISGGNILTLTICNQFHTTGDEHLRGTSDKRGLATLKRRLNKISGTIKLFETTETSQTIELCFPKMFK